MLASQVKHFFKSFKWLNKNIKFIFSYKLFFHIFQRLFLLILKLKINVKTSVYQSLSWVVKKQIESRAKCNRGSNTSILSISSKQKTAKRFVYLTIQNGSGPFCPQVDEACSMCPRPSSRLPVEGKHEPPSQFALTFSTPAIKNISIPKLTKYELDNYENFFYFLNSIIHLCIVISRLNCLIYL